MKTLTRTGRTLRADNRLTELLDGAARLFAHRGYAATSMRDIALEVDMLPSAAYYHFQSKEELLVAVYSAGVEELTVAAGKALDGETDPWARLEALCRVHLETVLQDSDYARVMLRVSPVDIPGAADRIRTLRAAYESFFRTTIADLPLPDRVDRRTLRLFLLGAINWAVHWFDPKATDTPADLARKFVALIKENHHG